MRAAFACPGARTRIAFSLMTPPLAWMTFEYGLASALRASCEAVGSWLGVSWGVAALLACAAAGILARPLARGGADDGAATRLWIARIALCGSGIFAIAIAFQTLATLIVPPCAR